MLFITLSALTFFPSIRYSRIGIRYSVFRYSSLGFFFFLYIFLILFRGWLRVVEPPWASLGDILFYRGSCYIFPLSDKLNIWLRTSGLPGIRLPDFRTSGLPDFRTSDLRLICSSLLPLKLYYYIKAVRGPLLAVTKEWIKCHFH